jgi:dipeptide/tripeptide permease
MEVWKESAFQKLLLFLVLTIGVRLVFTHQFLVMPKYYTRVLHSDFELGLANSINPFVIVVGLIVLIPVINRFPTVKLIIVGMAISAASLVVMALPLEWIMKVPGIHNVTQAYLFIIITQILVFAVGELIFNPRFTEYIASVSPPDKVSSYMALSALPAFISKPINGFVSGILISRYCYDGIRPKIETGNVGYGESPEFMWLIYLILAVMSPIAVIALRDFITRGNQPATATKGGNEA